MSQRIKVVGGPWPERIGCTGTIVERPAGLTGQVYPWPGRTSDELIVLLDNDPLEPAERSFRRYWSCAIRRRHIELLEAGHSAPDFLWTVALILFIVFLLDRLGVLR